MYLTSNNPEECYGCGACYNACSKQAISFHVSDDTYRYPVIDSNKCVDCGECGRVCPSQNVSFNHPKICVSAVAKDLGDWERSSSGGAFKVIALSYLRRSILMNKKFYLCACAWDCSFKVKHKIEQVNDASQIDKYCKSKYVQSDTGTVFREIRTLLSDDENNVLFVGTPCQVAGLKLFLHGRRIENLFCVDLVCKGAPSQIIFDKYKVELEETYGQPLKAYTFKNKKRLDNGTIYNRSAKIDFVDNSSRIVTRFTDDYVNIFYTMSYHFRPSCYSCQFHSPLRVGDITIGDAWNIAKIYPDLNPIKGVSLILFNTNQSESVLADIRRDMDTFDCDYSFMIEGNNALKVSDGNPIPKDILHHFFLGIMDEKKYFSQCVKEYSESIIMYKSKK